ncbi:MAG TPA: family 16 glycoside hydrolase, partial [Burkholderiales bacterium]|nr:family 16 glycoside hydrolase [Burkholderiales bacterium]
GKWNTLEIHARGPEVTVKMNGVVTTKMNNGKFPAGPFSLQFGNGPNDAPGGAIKWRAVRVHPL